MRRGLFAWSETCPNCGPSSTLLSGKSNCGRLKRLKTSTRNWRPSFPSGPNVVVLNNAKSQLLIPSARTAKGERRRVHKTGGVKPLVQSAFRRSAERRTVRARGGVKVGPERACKGVGQIIADIHMDWKAALERCNSIHTPSGNQLPGYSMNTLEISFPLAKWEVEHVAQDQALRYVEG